MDCTKNTEEYKKTETDEDKFFRYLSGFQEDLLRLIGSKRNAHHLMSAKEILSDFNFNAIKGKYKIINYRDERFKEFNFESFKYVMCCHVKNIVKWYHCRVRSSKFHARRNNSVVSTEEGIKSSFELVCETLGDKEGELSDENDKQKFILTLMRDYSEWLTQNEIEIISLMLQGHKQTEIQDILGVSHQAISFNFKRLKEKVKNRFKIKPFNDDNWKFISDGKKSIEDLFKR